MALLGAVSRGHGLGHHYLRDVVRIELGELTPELWAFELEAIPQDVEVSALWPVAQEFSGRDPAWDDNVLDAYERLTDVERTDALLFETIALHELTHWVDCRYTIAGALLRALVAAEVDALCRLIPAALADDVDISLAVPMWPADGFSENDASTLNTARACHRELTDYYAHLGEPALSRGYALLGRPPVSTFPGPGDVGLDVITIKFRDGYTTPSIRMPDGSYFRPGTAYEARAVANASRHLLARFSMRPDLARLELTRYLKTVYGSDTAADYLFIARFVAHTWGFDDLDALISDAPSLQVVDRVLADVGTLAWWAMGGPDIGQRLFASLFAYSELDPLTRQQAASAQLVELLDGVVSGAAIAAAASWMSTHEAYGVFPVLLKQHIPAVGPQVPSDVREYVVSRATQAIGAVAAVADDLGRHIVPSNGNPLAPLDTDGVRSALASLDPIPAPVAAWFEARGAIAARAAPSSLKRARWRRFLDATGTD